jgi:hypothetical protein
MRNHARGKGQTHFLCRGVNRSEEATAGKARSALSGIHTHLPHSSEVNHQAAIAGAKPCEAMTSASDRGDYTR